jgi:hydroxymethylbilane synthase
MGTSSLRRITQLKRLRDDLNCQPLRGNVETRIHKVQEGVVDAAVIAAAGVKRLGLAEMVSFTLELERFIPAPGQGALAIQTRADDRELVNLISQLNDDNARICTETERQVLAGLHGGCSIPLGVYARIENNTMHLDAILCNLSATKCITKSSSCPVDKAEDTAERITEQILDEGGREILEDIRATKEH